MVTSCFSNYKKSKRTGVGIAIKSPDWYTGFLYPPLYPKKDFLFKYFRDHDEESYTKSYYLRVLSVLDPQEVYDDLKDCVLLCYEKSGKFCHRRLVADWIYNEIGIYVPELK
jgi:hypothetical protein